MEQGASTKDVMIPLNFDGVPGQVWITEMTQIAWTDNSNDLKKHGARFFHVKFHSDTDKTDTRKEQLALAEAIANDPEYFYIAFHGHYNAGTNDALPDLSGQKVLWNRLSANLKNDVLTVNEIMNKTKTEGKEAVPNRNVCAVAMVSWKAEDQTFLDFRMGISTHY
jgi:hypothetical protein